MAHFTDIGEDEAAAPRDAFSPTRLVPLLAILFGVAMVAVLLLRIDAERTHAVERARASAARDAQILIAQVDARMLAARTALEAATLTLEADPTAAEMAARQAGRSPGVASVTVAAPDGTPLATIGSPVAGILGEVRQRLADDPLVAEVELVADGQPVLARRTEAGATTTVTLDPTALMPAPSDGRRFILATEAGTMLALAPAFANPTDAPAFGAFGQGSPARTGQPGGLIGVDPDGQRAIVGYARGQSGLWAYAAKTTEAFDKAWFGTLMFYLSLMAGVVLASLAFCAVVLGQSSRFRAARDALAETEQRLRFAMEGARCGIWDWDLGVDAVYLSHFAGQLFRFPEATRCSGNTLIARLVADDVPLLRAALNDAARGEPVDISVRVRGGDGIRWLQLRGRSVLERGAVPSIRVTGVCLDVTAQREAEERVMRAEGMLRDAIGSLAGPFALFDRRGGLVLWNHSYAETFGLGRDVLKAGTPYATVMAAVSKAISSARADDNDPQMREVALKSGRWLNMAERRTSEHGLVSIAIDITALKQQEEGLLSSERQLRALVAELGHANAQAAELADKYAVEKARAEDASNAKSAFLANMSHELRTPLNAINGFSEVMERQIFGPLGHPKYAEYVKDIHASGQHLLEMINDVLDMARIESGRFAIHPREMDPVEVIEQAVRLLRGRAEEKNLQLRVDLGDLPDIVADPRAVKQMLINLLGNAVKFTPTGGAIMVRARAVGDEVTIAVSDTGIGIPPAFLPRLARPFEQVEGELAKTHAGSGLGLALTKAFATLHGGRLDIDSEVGVGTTVTIHLPRVAVETAPADPFAPAISALARVA